MLHEGKIGSEVLRDGLELTSAGSIIKNLGGNAAAKFQIHPPSVIPNDILEKIRKHVDLEYQEIRINNDEDDFKLTLNRNQLTS